MQSKDRYFIPPNQSIQDIPRDVENLYLCGYGNDEENLTELDFPSFGFTQLQSITIGNHCFQNVRAFVLDGLEKLESVKIGSQCFNISSLCDDGICRITNCPNLTQLEIGDWSFEDFKLFKLSNVNSLQSIQFGDNCFPYAETCILKGEHEE